MYSARFSKALVGLGDVQGWVQGAPVGVGVPGLRLWLGFGLGEGNKQPSRDGAAVIGVGIAAVSAAAAQGQAWEWVEGKKKARCRLGGITQANTFSYGISPAARDAGVTLNTFWVLPPKRGI